MKTDPVDTVEEINEKLAVLCLALSKETLTKNEKADIEKNVEKIIASLEGFPVIYCLYLASCLLYCFTSSMRDGENQSHGNSDPMQ